MRVDELEYELPEELIAREPPAERDGGRLMHVPRDEALPITHQMIRELPSLVPSKALLVVNDTKVLSARLLGKKSTGGRIEILLLRALDESARRWKALGRASKGLKPGTTVQIDGGLDVLIDARSDDGTLVVVLQSDDPWAAIDRCGHMPLPPYMEREDRPEDRQRYQTVFAKNPGAVAAPTAGLHLTEKLLAEMESKGIERVSVTLHVGLGTFAPIQVQELDQHPMHEEWYDVPTATAEKVREAKANGRKIYAVGTTSVRSLESWGGTLDGALRGNTRLLLQPGVPFRVVDGLLTNLHLPRSTLLALVMAFAGIDRIRSAYRAAVKERYRFFSYGDAMLLD